LYEDQTTNRIHESLTLFEAICNNKFFSSAAMILFLNKTDLFAAKIGRVPLKRFFPTYTGPENNAHEAKVFIAKLFREASKNPNKQIYEHFTCATDTTNIKLVFDAVSDTIVEKHVRDVGLGF
jgi:guanine nucleotide-binding protein G(o) subunit alpha